MQPAVGVTDALFLLRGWGDGDIPALLDAAAQSLRESTQRQRLSGMFVRKERALFCRTRSRAALLLLAHWRLR